MSSGFTLAPTSLRVVQRGNSLPESSDNRPSGGDLARLPGARYVGAFDGEALRRNAGIRPEAASSILHDLAGALVALAFWAAFAFVLAASFLPDLPA
jgi:hypothetical protein